MDQIRSMGDASRRKMKNQNEEEVVAIYNTPSGLSMQFVSFGTIATHRKSRDSQPDQLVVQRLFWELVNLCNPCHNIDDW